MADGANHRLSLLIFLPALLTCSLSNFLTPLPFRLAAHLPAHLHIFLPIFTPSSSSSFPPVFLLTSTTHRPIQPLCHFTHMTKMSHVRVSYVGGRRT